jgi:hypothetical protein
MIAALKEAGGDARLTVYPGVGHDAWTPTFADPMLYELRSDTIHSLDFLAIFSASNRSA